MPPPARLGLAGALTLAGLALAACQPAPTATVPVDGEDRGFIPGGNYVLVGMDGQTVPLRNVTLLIEEKRISGQGPCNAYSAANNVPLPAVALSPIISTKMACKDLRLENRFLSILQTATAMDYYGGVLRVKSPSTWLIFEQGVVASTVSALDTARGTR